MRFLKLFKRYHHVHIAKLIAMALLLELALFPHAGQAVTGETSFIPVVTAMKGFTSTIIVQEKSTAKKMSVQALPVVEDVPPRFTRTVLITAYSSTVDQTDDTPFITANGTEVRDGIIAANFLQFGTRVKIPELYGDKVFYVTDRMHPRFSDRVDVWMESREQAVQFGVKVAMIEVY